MESDRRWVFSEPLDPVARKGMVYALNLLVLRTYDIERSRRFYEAIGLRFQFFEYGYGARSMQGPVPPDAPLVLDVKREGIPPPHTYLAWLDQPDFLATVDSLLDYKAKMRTGRRKNGR